MQQNNPKMIYMLSAYQPQRGRSGLWNEKIEKEVRVEWWTTATVCGFHDG